MTISDYASVLRKRWLSVFMMTLVGLGVAAGVTLLMPKSYQAQTTSFVSISAPGSSTDNNSSALYQNSQYALNQVQSYPAIAASSDVLRPVIDELGLNMTVRELSSRIQVTNTPNTVLLKIVATSASPQQAAQIANSVAEHLGQQVETLETPRAAKATSPVKITTAVPAEIPTTPSSPRPALNALLGLIVGVILGCLLAMIRDRLDTSVKQVEDLRAVTGAEPLGTIRSQSNVGAHPIMVADLRSAVVEDFRTVRTNLQYVDVDRPRPGVMVVTSAIANEGKSVFACNIALSIAHSGERVCLVEADLRRPKAAAYLGLDNSVGLTEAVIGERPLKDVLVPWGGTRLTVLPAGTMPPDPAQLLGSQACADLIGELRQLFDRVIIDAPPLLPVSDAAVLAKSADGVLLVARYGHVARADLRRCVTALRTVGAHLIGSVLNAVPKKSQSSYYQADYRASRPYETTMVDH